MACCALVTAAALYSPLAAEEPVSVPLTSLSLSEVVSGRSRIVDLSYPLNAQSLYWPGERYTPFHIETIATLEKDGVLSKKVTFPEHIGTHLDAPNHFESGAIDVSRIPAAQLFAAGVVINVAPQVEVNPEATLSVLQVEEWERQQGRIPEGAVVLLNTGWGRFWTQPQRYLNRDLNGRMRFPGFSAEAVRFLIENRKVKGIGIDTLSIDPGTSKTFPVHHLINKAGKYGLENVANLDQLPPRGFYLIVAPLKVEGGTGGPCRLFALLP
jgi:kynurenine formamidase